ARLQRLLDQQATEARAIDEQIAFDPLPAVKLDGFDMSVGAAQLDVDDFALDAPHSGLLGVAAQEARIEPGIEVEGVEHLVHGILRAAARTNELALARGHRA